MNDIEVLEELLKKKKCDIGYYMVYIFDDREKQAIENLLKEKQSDRERIKDLEEDLEKIDKALNLEPGIATPYRDEIIESLKRGITQFKKIIDNSIPKYLIKEKIEELKKEYKIALEENSTKAFILKCQIQVLEELLKGE